MTATLVGARRRVASIALGAAAAATLAACSAPTQPAANDAALQQLRLDAQAVAGAEASGDLPAARRRLAQLRDELSAARGTLPPTQVRRIQSAIARVAADLAIHRHEPSTSSSNGPSAGAPSRSRRVTPARTTHADLRPEPVSVPTSAPPEPAYAPAPHHHPGRPSHIAAPKHSDKRPAPKHGPDPAPGPKEHGPDHHKPDPHMPGPPKPDPHKPAPHGPADHRAPGDGPGHPGPADAPPRP